MKTRKLVLLTAVILLSISSNKSHAQSNEGPQTVIIRMVEFFSLYKGEIMVLHPDGRSKAIEIDRLKLKEFGVSSAENTKKLQGEIDLWKKKGFTIDGVSNAGGGENSLFTTIIMSKD